MVRAAARQPFFMRVNFKCGIKRNGDGIPQGPFRTRDPQERCLLPPPRAPSNFLRGPGFPAANSGGGSREGKEGVWVDELCAAGGG